MLPVVVNGRLVFIPFEADALASGLDALLDKLATAGAARDSAFAVSEEVHKWSLLSATQPDAAARAVPLLTATTTAFGSDYARSRAVNLAGLAGSLARAGDFDTAVSVGRHALEEICQTSRAYQRLRLLDDCLAVHQIADMADLRHAARSGRRIVAVVIWGRVVPWLMCSSPMRARTCPSSAG